MLNNGSNLQSTQESGQSNIYAMPEKKDSKLMAIQENVIKFIRVYFNMHDKEITGDSKLRLDLGLSSFELLEMCCSLEEELKIDINEGNLRRVVTINDVVKCLYYSSKGQASPQ